MRGKLTSVLEMTQPVMQVVENSFNDEKLSFDIIVINEGRSLNNTIYSKQNLIEIRDFINDPNALGSKMYLNHIQLEAGQAYPGRNVEDWAATMIKGYFEEDNDSQLFAHVQVTPQHKWVYELAKDPVHGKEFGTSVHVGAFVEEVDEWEGDGQPGVVIEQVVLLYSNDFVTEPAAGGGIRESEYSPGAKRIAKEALKLANKSATKDASLISVLESVIEEDDTQEKVPELDFGESLTKLLEWHGDEKISVDGDGNIVAFADAMDKEEREEDARETWWTIWRYASELAFDTEVGLNEKIEAVQNAIKVGFTKIDKLTNNGATDSKGLVANREAEGETDLQRTIIEDLKGKGIVGDVLRISAQAAIGKDLTTRGILTTHTK